MHCMSSTHTHTHAHTHSLTVCSALIEVMFVRFYRAAVISSTLLIRSSVQTCLLFEGSGQKMPWAVSLCWICTVNSLAQAKASSDIKRNEHHCIFFDLLVRFYDILQCRNSPTLLQLSKLSWKFTVPQYYGVHATSSSLILTQNNLK